MIFGVLASSFMWLFNFRGLGDGTSTGFHDDGLAFLRELLPSTLLLHTVRPATLKVYFECLLKFLSWVKSSGHPTIDGAAEMDDCLSRWIQYCFEQWRAGVASSGRQVCVNARCCLLLLRPRLLCRLQGSGKCLEGWKKLIPPIQFRPVPYLMLVGVMSFQLGEGDWVFALATWVTYHCLLRPGEALALKVRDVIRPVDPRGIIGGHVSGPIAQHEDWGSGTIG